jgi:hypothetical protein
MGVGVDLAVLRGQVLILKVENERLRAALELVCRYADEHDGHAECFAIAVAALANQQQTKPD